ncbi:MAG: galactosyltransferase-related protein [Bacteroidia bacterium]|nr:galactosyltransferase-related protein [Bacteroidia bacterium]
MELLTKLKDLTIIIPVRLDSIERLENILATTHFLLSNFETNIQIAEFSSYNNGLLEKLLDKSIRYTFQEDQDPILYRTRFLNMMSGTVDSKLVAVWDTDVIVPTDQVDKAVELLMIGEADFVYPYEKQFLDTSPILRKLYLEEGNIGILEQNSKKMKEMYHPNPVGGAFLAKMEAYQLAGLENEDFFGWGMEDGERFYRWENLGFRIKRVPGPLFHLSHGRGINSNFHTIDQQFFKRKEVVGVRRNNSANGFKSNNEQVPTR